MRLTRFLFHHASLGRKQARLALAAGRVSVGGEVVRDGAALVSEFAYVSLDGSLLAAKQATYIMLHKPAGYLSATKDPEHPTVMELVDESEDLHIAGRLDRASTGLLILTNDGKWSRRLTEPKEDVAKTYLIDTSEPITGDTHRKFEQGIYFAYEDVTTQPAELEVLSPCQCKLTIYEGRYHQIKRMFHAVGNNVRALHRLSVGKIHLGDLAVGECRHLRDEEI